MVLWQKAPPELAAEVARIGGEVRWFAPEQRLVAAVKFPRDFKGSDHARWCIKRERHRSHSISTLGKRGLDDQKWRDFVEDLLEKLASSIEISAKQIKENGGIFELRIDIVDEVDPQPGEGD